MSGPLDETRTDRFLLAQSLLLPITLAASGLWVLHQWQQRSRIFRMGNKLPGPKTIPFFGNALLAVGLKGEDFVKLGAHLQQKYGRVVRGWIGSKLLVFLMGPNDVEVILNSYEHIDKSTDYSFFKPWLGEGLLISSGEKWRSHRKIIAPTFHINVLKTFIDVFNEKSRSVMEKMRCEVGKVFDVHDYMSEVTVDILVETVMGISRKAQVESGFDYALAVMKMCDIIHQRHWKFWLRPDFLFKLSPWFKKQQELLGVIHGLTNKVIKIKRKTYEENKAKGITPKPLEDIIAGQPDSNGLVLANGDKTVSDAVFKSFRDDLDFNDENDVGQKERLAFLDLMLESAQNSTNNISDIEIKEEVDTIMFEGHDTTAAGSSFVLCMLGLHPDIQNQVYDELYEIFGDSDRPVTFADTLQMKLLERVILETLRLYPPVPIIARELKKDVQIATNDYVIPAGATVIVSPYAIHRNSDWFLDADKFNPDNFLPEHTQNRHYYSFVPFSAGPRSCVGRKYALLKLKILLSTILRHYKTTSAVPEDQFILTVDIILKRKDGFRILIEPRTRVPTFAKQN